MILMKCFFIENCKVKIKVILMVNKSKVYYFEEFIGNESENM